MIRNKYIIGIIILVLIFFGLIGCIYWNSIKQKIIGTSDEEINTETTDIDINYDAKELSGEISNYNAKVNLNDEQTTIEGTGITISGAKIKISNGGTYYFTGTISDASIVVEANKNEDVIIVLDNANITSKTTSVINGVTCKKLTVHALANSSNYLTDNSTYTDFTDTEKSEPDGTIFTKTDLVVNGNGKLVINGNYRDGIVSKDTLKLINTEIEINSADDGIRGKDYVAINNAKITINSKGDGIKSTNDEDTSLGYIAIEGGTLNIQSGSDGIQAQTILNISENPIINIVTSGTISSSNNSSSSKALKAGTEISIMNGDLTLNSTDDSIHSNGSVIINGGTLTITSGDDGIHGDTSLTINDGNIDILKSYEGIESSYIEINGGNVKVVASDDGINVAGGNDNSAMNGRPGQNNFSNIQNSNRKLVINNGNIKVDSKGDGLDSNGSIYINGGYIIVEGPENGGNGALDYDGECIVKGGTLIAYGATGMWQNPSNNATIYTVAFSNTGKSGDTLILKDSSNQEILNITSNKSYGGILFTSEQIKQGESYTLYVNGTSVQTLTVSDIITSNIMSSHGGMNKGNMNRGDMSGEDFERIKMNKEGMDREKGMMNQK